MSFQRILDPGRNCWRLEPADRVAFLIDGEAYFAAVHDTLRRAARAVGSAMATNDIALIIPCHRVIRESGRIGE